VLLYVGEHPGNDALLHNENVLLSSNSLLLTSSMNSAAKAFLCGVGDMI
jgi:hypothetical protein